MPKKATGKVKPTKAKPKAKKKTDDPFKNLKEGAFTKQAKASGMSVDKFSKHVIKNYKDKNSSYNPSLTTYRRALFVKNLAK